jgi:hypothetical protein
MTAIGTTMMNAETTAQGHTAVMASLIEAKSVTTETIGTATDAKPIAPFPAHHHANPAAVMESWTPVKNVTTETILMVMDAKPIALSVFARRLLNTIPTQVLLPFNTNTAMLNLSDTISLVSTRVMHP